MGWNTACPDWRERLLAGRPLVPALPLFRGEADKALRIFGRLRLPDVIGMPPMAEAAGEWFMALVEALFGSYDEVANRRMIQEFFLLVPKKNGKSSYAAAIMVVALIMNRRPNAEFLLIAPTMEIANIAYRQARGIIKADAELSKLFRPQPHIKTITHLKSGAVLQIKAADTDVITGSKSTGILVDETHVFSKKSNASDVFVEIRGALAARPDGFMLQISTQSKEPPAGVFKSELGVARDVRDGKLVMPILPILYELPDDIAADGGWKDRRYWPLVNPNMGRSVDETFLSNQLILAEREGPSQLALLASQHFNIEIGLNLRTDRWPGADYWQASAEPGLTLDELLRRSEVVVAGIDGGGLDDLLGLGVMGRERMTRRWLLWCHAWAHRIVLERRKEIAARLLDFEKAGNLTLVDDESDADIQGVADIIERINDIGLLPGKAAIGVDPVGISDIVDELERRGLSASTDEVAGHIVAVKQGWTLNNAILTAERRLAAGDLAHDDTGLMSWCVGNAKIEMRGNAVTITKQAAGKAKIDPLMAAFNCVSLMQQNPEARPESIYSVLDRIDGKQKPAESAQSDAKPMQTGADTWSPDVLRDPNHADFARHKALFEAWQAAQDDEEF